MIIKKIFFVSALFFLSFFSIDLHAGTAFDHSSWDAFLKKYVNERGEVDYKTIVKDPKELNDYLALLTAANEFEIRSSWPREEVLAYWLNAYHATLIKLVIENYPVVSVQKIPSFWDIAAFHIGNAKTGQKQYSLNDIRTKNLIGTFRDEKVHLALSSAAKGGPKLTSEAFTGPKVEGQLFLLTRQFVNDPAYVDITPGRKIIRISRIFKWYGQDFNLDFGTPEPLGKFSVADTAVLAFLAYYLEDEAKGEFLQQGNYKIEYPSFDWSLNDQKSDTVSK